MSNPLLISYNTLINASEIPGNIDPNIIRPIIKEVQDMRVEPVIGTKLFRSLKDKVDNNAAIDDYATLLNEYIQPVMIYGVLCELPIRLGFRPTNQGFVAKTSEASSNNSNDDLHRISKYYEARREFYANKLTAYLCENESKFPEYRSESELDEVRPNNSTYETGLFLGRSKKKYISQKDWDNKNFEVH